MINLNDVLYKEISNRIIENPSNPFESKNILYVILKSNKPFIMIFDLKNVVKRSKRKIIKVFMMIILVYLQIKKQEFNPAFK